MERPGVELNPNDPIETLVRRVIADQLVELGLSENAANARDDADTIVRAINGAMLDAFTTSVPVGAPQFVQLDGG